MKNIPTKYLKIGGIAFGTIALGVGVIVVIKKITKPTNKQRITKEDKKLKNTSVILGADGYVNVRSSPMVDNENWLRADFTNNLLKKVTSSPVGTILKRVKGKDAYYWYELQLETPIDGKPTGYVREDVVELKK